MTEIKTIANLAWIVRAVPVAWFAKKISNDLRINRINIRLKILSSSTKTKTITRFGSMEKKPHEKNRSISRDNRSIFGNINGKSTAFHLKFHLSWRFIKNDFFRMFSIFDGMFSRRSVFFFCILKRCNLYSLS